MVSYFLIRDLIMKKLKRIAILIASFFSFLLPSCEINNLTKEGDYKLTITGHTDLVLEGPHLKDNNKKQSYFNAGDVVVFSVGVVYDVETVFKLNGHKMEEAIEFDQDSYEKGILHSFTMPKQDSVLDIILSDGFYSLDHAPLVHYYDWIKYLDEEEILSATYYAPCVGVPTLGNFNSYYTASKEEIHNLYQFLNNTYVDKEEYQPVEPGTVSNSIHIETIYGDEYSISANNRRIKSSQDDNCTYKLSNPLPTFKTLKGYTLNEQSLYDIVVLDASNNSKDVTSSFYIERLKLMSFVVEDDVEFPAVINEYNRYHLENSWGKIIFESSLSFVIHDNEMGRFVCKIVNGLTFEQLKK